MCNYTLVVGYGSVGSLLGSKLAEAGIPLVVVENSKLDRLSEEEKVGNCPI